MEAHSDYGRVVRVWYQLALPGKFAGNKFTIQKCEWVLVQKKNIMRRLKLSVMLGCGGPNWGGSTKVEGDHFYAFTRQDG
jgi:hypothetical protein